MGSAVRAAALVASVTLAFAALAAASPRVPGDVMVYKNNDNGPNPMSVKTAALPTYNFTVRGPQPRQIFAMDFDLAANVLWGIDNATREIGQINVATGAFTPVSTINPPLPGTAFVVGMSFDPTSALVYLLVQNQSGATLHTVVLATGAKTDVATMGGGFVDISIDAGGQMFGLNIVGASRLYRIDKVTGLATSVGNTGMTLAITNMGLDFDYSDGTLYGCVRDTLAMGHLIRINTTTGAATILASADETVECAVDVPAGPAASLQAVALDVDAGGNRVLQPNEPAVVVAPTWRNNGAAAAVSGTAGAFGGPPGPTYTLNDASASYGTLATGGQASCAATGDCYAVTAAAASRPAAHWDATFDEAVTPGPSPRTWTLHIGDSFTDVPAANPFYRFVETLLHRGVTGGCSPAAYCPATATAREQMAVFVLIAREPPGYSPAPCGPTPLFADVPDTSPFCKWIEELANRGVVSGCGGGNYCPSAPVTREAMSVFVLRTLDPGLSPPACGTPMFSDVPASSPFCKWIEELARRGVVTGCGGGNYCPAQPVTREQMGVFLAVTFALSLYGL